MEIEWNNKEKTMNQNKKILFVFMLILGMIGGQLYSPESNAMPKKVKKQYTKVLQKFTIKLRTKK